MHGRRLLLVDSDADFEALLKQQLSPYGIELVVIPPDDNPLGQVKDIDPVLIAIAVELPDKVGYRLCNKAKKGVAKDIPVILTTSTVPASGFNSHRKLKVHADEYLDKRADDTGAILTKIDQLISLGEAAHAPEESLDIPMEIEEMEIEDDLDAGALDVEEVELGDFEDGARTTVAPMGVVDDGIDAETDAAFAALGFGEEEKSAPRRVAEPIASQEEDEIAVEEIEELSLTDISIEEDEAPESDVMEAGPDERTMIQSSADLLGETTGGVPVVVPDPMEAAVEIEDLPPAEVAPIAEPVEEMSAVPAPIEEPAAAEEVAEAIPEPIDHPSNLSPVAPEELDLGLDAVADIAEEERAAAPEDPAVREKLTALSNENSRLQAEIEQLKKSAGSGGSSFSREREFLNLREVINKKEKEIVDLHDEVGRKDRLILDSKETLHKLERSKAELDSTNLSLEQDLLEANERVASQAAAQQGLESARAGLEKELAAEKAALSETKEQLAGQIARLEEAERKHQEDAAALEQEKESALEAQKEELEKEHSSELSALSKAHRRTLVSKEKELEGQLVEAQAAAAADKDAALAEAAQEKANALTELSGKHQEELDAQTSRHASQLSRLEEENSSALAAAESQRQTDLAAADERREQELSAAESRRASDLAKAAEERANAENELQEGFEASKTALEQSHAEVVSGLEGEKSQLESALSSARSEIETLKGSVASERATVAERNEEIDGHKQTIAQRDDRIAALRQEVDELEVQNATYQEQVLKAYQKIKTDEAVVGRAKKAMAIALTLLDEGSDDELGAAQQSEEQEQA